MPETNVNLSSVGAVRGRFIKSTDEYKHEGADTLRVTAADEFKPELCFDEATGRWFLKIFANPNSYRGAKMITELALAEMRTRIEANKPFIYWGNLSMEERLTFLETTHRTVSRLSSYDSCDQTLDDVIKAQEQEVQRLKDTKAERDIVTSASFYPTEEHKT